MSDAHSVWNWVSAHLQAVLFVLKAHWHALVERVGPPLQAAIDWANADLKSAIAWARPSLHAATDLVRPYVALAIAFVVAYWIAIAIAAAAAAAFIAIVAWLRRRRRVKATLVDVTLERDPKTDWFRLGIVVENFQSHALLVHSLRVLHPLDVRICEHWKAWQPSGAGVKFVAPDLDLTNEAEIERTIPPHGASGEYRAAGGLPPARGGADTQLRRIFYLLAPVAPTTRPVKLRAVLRCELQTPRGRKQVHLFHRLLEPVARSRAAAVAT